MKILILTITTTAILCANEYVVITNKNLNIDLLTQLQVKAIFLKKNLIVNDKKMVPINLLASDQIRTSFEKNILHMSRSRLKSFWTKEHYQGQRAPLNMKSSRSVIAFVKKIDGAIGYVPLSDVDDSIKTVYKWSE